MRTIHLALGEHTLCHRRMDRFTITVFEDRNAQATCHTCQTVRHLPRYADAMPVEVETCDACDTGQVTVRESYDLPNRLDPTAPMVRWHAWTACDRHGHDVFDMPRFRKALATVVDGLTDDEYRAATGMAA